MRKELFLLTFLSIAFNSLQAQPFLPIVKEGAVWHQWVGWGAPPDPSYDANWTYQLIGDTVINGLGYKKLIATAGWNWWFTGFTGALREDSGKVYYKQLYDTISNEGNWCLDMNGWWTDSIDMSSEVLLYDFNLSVGDSFFVYRVNYVGSVTLADGLPRKRIELSTDSIHNGSSWYDWMEWIEGIGSTEGLIEGGCLMFENETSLSCYADSTVRYPVGCLGVSNKSTEQTPSWTIYPNPANSEIKLNLTRSGPAELVIKNMLGEAILSKRVTESATINVEELAPGLYSISLFQDNKSVGNQQLVIVK